MHQFRSRVGSLLQIVLSLQALPRLKVRLQEGMPSVAHGVLKSTNDKMPSMPGRTSACRGMLEMRN